MVLQAVETNPLSGGQMHKARFRAKRGARLLDVVDPGWALKIPNQNDGNRRYDVVDRVHGALGGEQGLQDLGVNAGIRFPAAAFCDGVLNLDHFGLFASGQFGLDREFDAEIDVLDRTWERLIKARRVKQPGRRAA